MGQSKKKRACPAVDREITASECGQNRQSQYRCPGSCTFNPFAPSNYDALLEIEDRLDAATIKALKADPVVSKLHDADMRRQKTELGLHATTVRHLFIERDASGQTFAERWLARGGDGLLNDARLLFRCKMQMRVALLEIHRVIDECQFEAVDLLTPEREALRFVDRSAAATALRFQTLLAWVYPAPHFGRLSGSGIGVHDVVPLPALEVLDECIRHLDGPTDETARAYWLARNFERISDVLFATRHQRRRLMLESIDGVSGSATYEIVGSVSECETAIGASPFSVAELLSKEDAAKGFTAGFVWLDPEKKAPALPGTRILGKVFLGTKELRVEAFGGASLDELRRRIEALLGPRVRFSRERRDNWAGQMLAKEPRVEPGLIPARFMENPPEYEYSTSSLPEIPSGVSRAEFQARLFRDQHQRLLDESIPALGGLTPRQASRDSAARAGLVEWAKGLIRHADKMNLETGRMEDVNWIIRELGLAELDFPAPPARPIPEDVENADSDDLLDEESGGPELFEDFDEADMDALTKRANDWSAPPLPEGPMSEEEAVERLNKVTDAFPTPLAAVGELAQSGMGILEDVRAICGEDLERDDFAALLMYVAPVWFAMVPKGHRPKLRFEVMVEAYDGGLDLLEAEPQNVMQIMLADSPQQNLLGIVLAQMAEDTNEPSSPVPTLAEENVVFAGMMIKVLIAELDHALRK